MGIFYDIFFCYTMIHIAQISHNANFGLPQKMRQPRDACTINSIETSKDIVTLYFGNFKKQYSRSLRYVFLIHIYKQYASIYFKRGRDASKGVPCKALEDIKSISIRFFPPNSSTYTILHRGFIGTIWNQSGPKRFKKVGKNTEN